MFNSFLTSDDVEVYEVSASYSGGIVLNENCKTNILVSFQAATNANIQLPYTANIGKIINVTVFTAIAATGKTAITASCIIQHSGISIFTIKQGTVSFMYVGQKLNGLTTTNQALSGWVILGGAQGDTSITAPVYSLSLGAGSYCSSSAAVALGYNNSATGSNGIAVGNGDYASSTNGVAIGTSCNSSGSYAMAIGTGCGASAVFSIALGYQAKAESSKVAFKPNSNFSASGDAQAGKFVLIRQTTDATATVLTANAGAVSATNILSLPNNATYAFKGIVVAKNTTTLDSDMWEVTALIKRGANASTTTLVGTPTITKLFADSGASAWTIALTADTTYGGGIITVTGEASKTIKWVTNIDSAEVI